MSLLREHLVRTPFTRNINHICGLLQTQVLIQVGPWHLIPSHHIGVTIDVIEAFNSTSSDLLDDSPLGVFRSCHGQGVLQNTEFQKSEEVVYIKSELKSVASSSKLVLC